MRQNLLLDEFNQFAIERASSFLPPDPRTGLGEVSNEFTSSSCPIGFLETAQSRLHEKVLVGSEGARHEGGKAKCVRSPVEERK